jgi:hypothetical protein
MGSTPDSTASGLSSGANMAIAFRYVNSNTVLDSTATAATNTTGMPDCPPITTVNDKSTIVAIGYLDDDVVASSIDFPGKYTLIGARQYGSSGSGGTVMAAYYNQLTAGTDNPDVFTGSGTDSWVGVTFALRA